MTSPENKNETKMENIEILSFNCYENIKSL